MHVAFAVHGGCNVQIATNFYCLRFSNSAEVPVGGGREGRGDLGGGGQIVTLTGSVK